MSIATAYAQGRSVRNVREEVVHPSIVCEHCWTRERIEGERYCRQCKPAVLNLLSKRGVFQKLPAPDLGRQFCGRPPGPHSGDDDPEWDNVIRASEDG